MKILIADDNVDAAQTLATLLELLGHRVALAYDGEEALRATTAFAPQALICDIGMPRMDGYQVARRIRSTAGESALPLLIACTGYGNAEDLRAAREAGFHHHLTKPADIGHLLRMLASAPPGPATMDAALQAPGKPGGT